MSSVLLDVAVNAPINETLTYSVPEHLSLERGHSVTVPLGKRLTDAVVIGKKNVEPQGFKIKDIESANQDLPQLRDEFLRWAE